LNRVSKRAEEKRKNHAEFRITVVLSAGGGKGREKKAQKPEEEEELESRCAKRVVVLGILEET